MVSKQQRKINDLLLPVVEAMGYEFVGCKYIPQGAYTVLRVYIDKEGGVTLDDCSKVSAQLSAVLDVEEPITGRYTLEVSSPGSDRPLFTLEHFQHFVGYNVAIRLHTPMDGRRNFKGKIVSVDDNIIAIDVDGEIFKLSFENIEIANLNNNV
ncbi:MAG: ribosome maturation factor RimP [Gammaproteobacteria bacterium]|jgi:ribosome maturation factor RimP